MELEVNIGISNRHVHLSKDVYEKLFDSELQIERPLSQQGMYVSDKRVTLITDDYEKQDVKVLGPLRDYTQVEISHNDAIRFGINPPVRTSGHLDGAEKITLKTDKGEVSINACIIPERHLHISRSDAEKYGIKNGQKLFFRINGIKKGIVEVFAKISEEASLEVHLDTDDANAFIINQNDKGTLIIS